VKDLATSSFAKAAEDIKNAKKAWPTARLGDVCEIVYGTRVRKKDSIGDEYPVYGGGGETFRWDTFNRENQCVVSRFAMSEECVRFVKGKFFLNDSGLTVDSRDVRLLQSFLDWFLFGNQEVIYFFGKGSAQRNLDIGEFSSISIPLPPLTVQCEIVARLEKELGEADRLAAKFKRVAELADDAFKAELDETFKALEDNSRRDAETRRVRLGDVCERITKGTTPTSVGYCFVESGINFVKIESFSEDGTVLINRVAHISPECHLALKRSQLQAEDVLFSIAGAIGRVAIVGEDLLPANTNQALAIIRTSKEKSLDVKFLKYSLCSCSVKEQYVPMQKTTAQSNLSLQNVSDFILSIPTLDAQRAIVAKLDAAKERCEKLKAAAMRGLAAAENLRKAILAEAFEQ